MYDVESDKTALKHIDEQKEVLREQLRAQSAQSDQIYAEIDALLKKGNLIYDRIIEHGCDYSVSEQ
jgi:hypothetical protein